MKKLLIISFIACIVGQTSFAQVRGKALTGEQMKQAFLHPPEAAKPWIFWYWMQASVTKEGIKADLQAMKYEGIGGAYLMPIKGPANPPLSQSAGKSINSGVVGYGKVRHARGRQIRIEDRYA